MNKRQKKKNRRLRNKRLCERYPFLIPRNLFTGKIIWLNGGRSKYDWTLLDDIPEGWRKAFGVKMCEDLRDELIKFNFLEEYRVHQIKEKYGELRWYDNGYPVGSKVHEIISAYEVISSNVCIKCGKPDVPLINDGWISPYCEKCWLKMFKSATHEDYEKCRDDDGTIQESYKVRTYGDGVFLEKTFDISDKVAKIRARYRSNG